VALGATLLAVGAYQLTPLKRVCLTHCRSPFAFVAQHWRDGRLGPRQMGLRHGGYCLGCCWALFAVMVAAGVMSLAWMLLLTLLVFVEKELPQGRRAAPRGRSRPDCFGVAGRERRRVDALDRVKHGGADRPQPDRPHRASACCERGGAAGWRRRARSACDFVFGGCVACAQRPMRAHGGPDVPRRVGRARHVSDAAGVALDAAVEPVAGARRRVRRHRLSRRRGALAQPASACTRIIATGNRFMRVPHFPRPSTCGVSEQRLAI
jgi:hypothetical protein